MIRLLTLLAVMMLPFGMARANAMQPMANHHAMTGMGTMTPGHCDEMDRSASPHGDHKAPGECAMACASALPALPAASTVLVARPPAPERLVAAIATTLHGLILEIATPPPRFA